MPLSTAHIEETFTNREAGIKKLLWNILNLNLQHESNEKSIISIINKLLSTAKSRKEGLEYLKLLINSCSASVIAENSLNWVNHCIIKFPDDILREMKLSLLGEIIEGSHNDSDFNKKFISDYISKVLDNCVTTSHVNLYECKTALKTLTICMKYYPSWFGPHRQKMESFILIFMDHEDLELVERAALAFHYLQQVGGAGSNAANHKANFTQAFKKLCKTVHKLYDSFFENETEIFNFESSYEECFEFKENPAQDSQALLHVNARRIRNVFKFIEIMIRTAYPVAKETRPKELLEVICRGTSLHKCITSDNEESLETYQFSLLLLEIQCAALKLLRLFIIWYQINCLPFSYSISKVIVDSIERSHNCDCYKSDSLYQECAYRALSEWISISKSSLHPQFQHKLLECILIDITPIKTQVTLTISEAASGKKSQKAKRRAMANRIISSGNQSAKESGTRHERCSERTTCQFALTALRHLLENTKLNVKDDLLKDLYKSIFDSLINLQSGKPLHPYMDPQCQARLYEILVAIYHQNTLSILPPLHTSLDILNRGSNNNNRFIASVCHKGLRLLELLCQPVCPSLYIGSEKGDEEPKVMREVIEEHEMDADSASANSERQSVDFDASTDELSNQGEAGGTVESSSEMPYHVRYTDTDRSTIDDGLSEKGRRSGEFEAEEIYSDGFQTADSVKEMEVSEHPVVTAPSEDGNEVLEGEIIAEEKLEPIPEEPQIEEVDENRQDEAMATSEEDTNGGNEEDQERTTEDNVLPDNNKTATEFSGTAMKVEEINEDETVSTSGIKDTSFEDKEDTNIDLKGDSDNEPQGEEISESPQVVIEENAVAKEESDDVSEEPTNSYEQPIVNEVRSGEVNDIENAEVSNSYQRDCEEPSPKKAKTTHDEDAGDVLAEDTDKKDDDPDASYLEDDSFVDEVKDYY